MTSCIDPRTVYVGRHKGYVTSNGNIRSVHAGYTQFSMYPNHTRNTKLGTRVTNFVLSKSVALLALNTPASLLESAVSHCRSFPSPAA